MKKLSFVCLLLAVVCGAYYSFAVFSPSASAQTRSARTKGADESDRRLAAEIRKLTNRARSESHQKGGETEVDLLGGFQNVSLARMGDDEHIEGYCVNSIEEANAFFGRDLEKGGSVPRIELPGRDLTQTAADHGMSLDDFVLYSKMAGEFASLQASPQSSTLNIVNNDGPDEGFNDTTPAFVVGEGGNNGATKGDQRLNVFLAAAAIWGNFLDSSVPIQIRSQMDPQTCSTSGAVLGSAGATTVHSNFTNTPFASTWYNQALANKLSGSDRSTQPDINATFNISIDSGCLSPGSRWYYGLDNATPSGRINLLVVLLHEMGHGLGFQTFANGSTGELYNGLPDQWSRMMYDAATGQRWNTMTAAQRQASALSNGGLLWDGGNAMNAGGYLSSGRDGSGRIRLYAPTSFVSGSSVSHFDTFCFPNLLMEPNINSGLPIDLDLTRQLMRDIGWYRDTNADLVPDTITNVLPASGAADIGTTRQITWTNNGGFSRNVTIELSTDGGSTFPTAIATNIPNTGSYQWTVPNVPTTNARIRVREANFLAPLGTSSGNFTIRAASQVTLSGRVLGSTGRPIRGATVVVTGPSGMVYTTTNDKGFYSIPGLSTGVLYSVTARNRRYDFPTLAVTLSDNLGGFNITAR